MRKSVLICIAGAMLASFTCFTCMGIANAQVKLRMGYETPPGDSQDEAAKLFKQLVEQQTKGGITIELYPDNQLGNNAELIAGVRAGTIDITVMGSNNMARFSPLLDIIDLPFLFASREDAYRVLDGSLGEEMMAPLKDHNLRGLAFWENGFREMTNNVRPITHPQDLKGLKMRVPTNPLQVKLFESLGAEPVPMSLSDLYTALESGEVDGQDHPLGVVFSTKYYNVQKYLSLTHHEYGALLQVMTRATFEKLSAAEQKIILSAAREAATYQRKLNAENLEKQIKTFKQAGMVVNDGIDPGPFKDIVYEPLMEYFLQQSGTKGAELLKRVEAELARR